LLKDPRVDVFQSAIYGLGHLDDPDKARLVSPFARHRNSEVRYSVAFALGGSTKPPAVRALIKLSSDKNLKVRDWATFGIGSLMGKDSPAIREALFKRLSDTHSDPRGEALVGLAARKDARVIAYIQRDLRTERPSKYTLDAAYEFGDPVFLPALKNLWRGIKHHGKTHSIWCTNLKYAIKTCTPRKAKKRSA
jgi:hypothetical protein